MTRRIYVGCKHTHPFPMKAIGFVDRLNGGYRAYVIRSGVKDIDGNNTVLHESWHHTPQAAREAYQRAIVGLKMVSEYTNCHQPKETTP